MMTFHVRCNHRKYPIFVGAPLERIGRPLMKLGFQKAMIVSHPSIASRFGKLILLSLKQSKISCHTALVPEGEKSKSLSAVRRLYRTCIRNRMDRKSCIIALGGGVIGDVAGFAAATYMRGIPLIQAPTTLLAMVDSSIGGKTGVDLPEAKNCVGAFHQPELVWSDITTLKTLPGNEFRNGMAEVIKYGVIKDEQLFCILEKRAPLLFTDHCSLIADIVCRCVKIKAEVVSKDEKETKGLREILNFGHTIGHAVETVTRYRGYKHGEAISIGMCAAGFISRLLDLWSAEDQSRMEDLILRAGLPVRLCQGLPQDQILKALFRDKKTLKGELRFVLPLKIGKVIVRKISPALALKGIEYIQQDQK